MGSALQRYYFFIIKKPPGEMSPNTPGGKDMKNVKVVSLLISFKVFGYYKDTKIMIKKTKPLVFLPSKKNPLNTAVKGNFHSIWGFVNCKSS